MNKIRTGIWIVILVLLMVLFFQNQSIFTSPQTLKMDLPFVKYQTPQLPNGLYYLATLIIGLLISYLFGLADRFKARRAIKSLSATIDSHRQEMTTLKKEIGELKRMPPPEPPPVIELPSPTDPVVLNTVIGQSTAKPAEPPIDLPEPPESEKTDETDHTPDTEAKKGAAY